MGTSNWSSTGVSWAAALREHRKVGSEFERKEIEGDLKREREVVGWRRHLCWFRDWALVKDTRELEVAAMDGD